VNPSAERNREPILSVLRSALDLARPLRCLEIASGSGTHVGHFAEQLPEVQWQPSDCDPANMDSLCAYQQASSHGNIRDPLVIDISKTVELEPGFEPDLLLCINMIHISPWACTLGLMANAGKAEQLKYLQPSLFVVGQLLREGGKLITYGPYSVNGVLEPESNRQFDQNLKGMNFEWGIRDVRDIETEAAREGLELTNIEEMPANNKMLIFVKRST